VRCFCAFSALATTKTGKDHRRFPPVFFNRLLVVSLHEELKTTAEILSKIKSQNRLPIGKMLRIGLGANSPVLVPSTMY
jgi:hypothetical protein